MFLHCGSTCTTIQQMMATLALFGLLQMAKVEVATLFSNLRLRLLQIANVGVKDNYPKLIEVTA
jgi:hypothetical protein